MAINFWICEKETKASLLKGGFDTLKEAIKYYNNLKPWKRNLYVILNKDRTKILYPKSEKDK